MAIITLSRQLGCSGSQVAEDIAEQLGYQTVGKKEITDMIVKYTDQYSQELKSQKKLERAEEEVQAGLFERLRHDHSSYVNLLTSLIYDIAGQDKTIIKGHGAQIVLSKQPHVFHVRLTGSFDFRVSRIENQRQLNREAAEQLVKKDDRDRMGLKRYLFHRDLTGPKWYDVVIDIEKIGVRDVVNMIVIATRSLEKGFPTTQTWLESMRARGLTNLVRAVVKKAMPDMTEVEVIASTNGIVTLYGNVAREKEKKSLEQRVRSLPKVQDVVNNIKVVTPL